MISKLAYAYYDNYAESFARRFFGEDLPPFSSLVKNTSMVFVNSFSLLHGVRPNTPQVIEIGGIHVKPAKQLPHVSSSTDVIVSYLDLFWNVIAGKIAFSLFHEIGLGLFRLYKLTFQLISAGLYCINNIS